MGNNEKSILRTLLYSDLFDFPLSQDELYYYLNTQKTISRSQMLVSIAKLGTKIIYKNGYYCLSGKEMTVIKRKGMQVDYQAKVASARTITRLLRHIPSVLFIGISGSVAVGNAKKQDDIDLFIITSEKSIFATRLICLTFLSILGKRRKRQETDTSGKICLNMFIDTSVLSTEKSRQDIYTAREIAQLFPLFERSGTYSKFLSANTWIGSFLPHAIEGRTDTNYLKVKSSFLWNVSLVESLARSLQIWIIKRHLTTEVVTKKYLAFHPQDSRILVMSEYNKRVQKANLL